VILLIDNYDSFVHNLARYLRLLGHVVEVRRNDRIELPEIQQRVDQGAISAVVLSPGPCSPNEAGICLPLVAKCYQQVPILGICLGHQAIAQALGGEVVRWDAPVHGQADWIFHDQQKDFASLPSPFVAGRYHSLVVSERTLPAFFDISARLADGTIMGIRHRRLPIAGYQFHPESILTPLGQTLLARYLAWVGLADGFSSAGDFSAAPGDGGAPWPDRPRELKDDYPPGCQPAAPPRLNEATPSQRLEPRPVPTTDADPASPPKGLTS
jgi:anthranilate synthase component 2